MNARVQFRERQRLAASDLQADQDYLRDAGLAHQRRPHGTGVLFGLEVFRELQTVWVRAGAATDPSGRLLILPETQDVTSLVTESLKAKSLALWLSAVDEASDTRQRGRRDCGAGRHDRVAEKAVVTVQPSEADLPDAVKLAVVRISGSRISRVDPAFHPSYSRLLAASIVAPARDWRIQLGTLDRRDAYHFAVGEAGQARLALAKDGSLRVAGGLEILGVRASAQLEARGASRALKLVAREMGQGTRIDAKLERVKGQTFKLTLSASGAPMPETYEGSLKSLVEEVNRDSALVRASRPKFAASAVRLDSPDRPLALPYLGLRLGALSFQRAIAPSPIAVPWRLAFLTLPKEKGGREPLLVGLGDAGDRGDRTRRFEVGHHAGSTANFCTLLSIGADRTVTLHGKKDPNTAGSAALRVTGRVVQRPLPNDPSNDLFKELLVLATISGFLSVAAEDKELTLTFENVPAVIPVNHPWAYTLLIAHKSGARLLWLVENIDPDAGGVPSALFLSNQTVSASGFRQQVGHDTGHPNPGTVPLHVAVTAKRGAASICQRQKTNVVFERALELDLSKLPETAPPGVAWGDGDIAARNPCSVRGIILERLETARTRLGETPTDWTEVFTGNLEIDAGKSKPVFTMVDAGSDADYQLNFRASYSYADDAARIPPWQCIASQVVVVRKQVAINVSNVPVSIAAGASWQYDVELRDVTALPVTGLLLHQRLVDQSGHEIDSRDIASGLSLGENGSYSTGVQNPGMSDSVSRVKVYLRVEFSHDGHPWAYEELVATVSVS